MTQIVSIARAVLAVARPEGEPFGNEQRKEQHPVDLVAARHRAPGLGHGARQLLDDLRWPDGRIVDRTGRISRSEPVTVGSGR